MRTGRQIMVAWLQDEMRHATVADLQRAAELLEFARHVREGSKQQRQRARAGWHRFANSDNT